MINISEHLGVVGDVLAKLRIRHDHWLRDDLFAAGVVGLALAAERFDESRGPSFYASATYAVRSEVQSALGSMAWAVSVPLHTVNHTEHRRELVATQVSIDDRPDDAAPVELAADLPCVEDEIARAWDLAILEESIESLEPPERSLIREHDLDGVTLEEIALREGVTKSAVHARRKAILSKLRKRMQRKRACLSDASVLRRHCD